jgi:hypothetical protein
LFNKKIKTDVWALGVGIGIRLFRHISDHEIHDFECV